MTARAPADGGGTIAATANPQRADEAVAWFRARVPVPRATWDGLEAAARQRAFTVAGTTSLDVLADVWRAIDRAVADGTTFEAFKQQVGEQLAREWGRRDSGRLETIFRNNVQSAYAAGRFTQMTAPEIVAVRPFWQFNAILDARTTPICAPLDGLIRGAGDGFWAAHYPPLHHNCRSGVITLTEAQTAAAGGASSVPEGDPPQTGWGSTAGLGAWHPDLAAYPPELAGAFAHWNVSRA